MAKEQIKHILQSKGFAVGVASVVSSAATFLVARKLLSDRYAALAELEIQQAREYFKRLDKTGEYAHPANLVPEVPEEETESEEVRDLVKTATILGKEGYVAYNKATEPAEVHTEIVELAADIEDVPVLTNIFDGHDPVEGVRPLDLDRELDKKAASKPYVISSEEYFENENDYSMTSLTYYAGDEVLSDDQDRPIDNVRAVIGDPENLSFGYGSDNADIVYIQNDRFRATYEVARTDMTYAEAVAGLRHSESRRQSRR